MCSQVVNWKIGEVGGQELFTNRKKKGASQKSSLYKTMNLIMVHVQHKIDGWDWKTRSGNIDVHVRYRI